MNNSSRIQERRVNQACKTMTGQFNQAELPTQKKPTSVLDETYFSNSTTISVITLKIQEHASAL